MVTPTFRARSRRAIDLAAWLVIAGVAPWPWTAPARGADTAPPVRTVVIEKSAYIPREITIAPGTKVLWTNHDDMPHTVTGNDRTFASKGLDTDDKFEYTFSSEGTFAYHCSVHPYMTGVVNVRK